MSHAVLSPSSAPRWVPCSAAPAMCRDLPDTAGADARYGSAGHALVAANLTGVKCGSGPYTAPHVNVDGELIAIDDEMREAAKVCETYALSLGCHFDVEQELPIGHLTGEVGAHGTTDLAALPPGELLVCDWKFGRGWLVNADSEQMVIYGLAAMDHYDMAHEFDRVRLVIVQPRIGHVSEVVYSREEMEKHRIRIANAAQSARFCLDQVAAGLAIEREYFSPGETQCKFCRAKAWCPALREFAISAVAPDAFVDLTQPVAPQLAGAAECTYDNALLGNLLGAVPLVEDWCKAIRARVESELIDGRDVPGWKLVEGKRGARAWASAEQAEELMKSMRLRIEQMYDLKLISPTSAEKLAKQAFLGPRQWDKLKGLVVQPDGKPSVAPASDKRPAIQVSVSPTDFDNVAEGVTA